MIERRRSTLTRQALATRSISLNTTKRQTIDDFLVARNGRPFRLDPKQANTPLASAWHCTSWAWQWVGPGTWTLTADLEEVAGWM